MPKNIEKWNRVHATLFSALLLVSCSSLPDSADPDHWFDDGGDVDSGAYPQIVDDKRPEPQSVRERDEAAKGLAADLANAHHTQEALNREGTPTRPLNPEMAKMNPDTVKTSVRKAEIKAEAPAASPKKASQDVASSAPPPVPEEAAPVPQGTAASEPSAVPEKIAPVSQEVTASEPPAAPEEAAASAPPAPEEAAPVSQDTAASVPPPPAVSVSEEKTPAAPVSQKAPESPAPPAKAPAAAPPVQEAQQPALPVRETVQQVYQRRLAEWQTVSSPVVKPSAPLTPGVSGWAPPPSAPDAAPVVVAANTIHLVPPAEYHHKVSHGNGGFQSLDDYHGDQTAASFQVGELTFGEGSAALSAEGQNRLQDVARLAKETNGAVRIFGHSASSRLDIDPAANREANQQLARERALQIAHELVKMGIPARKIYAGSAGQTLLPVSGEVAEIYLDY